MLIDTLALAPDELLAQTGWEIKPEGACKDDVCVPLTGVSTRDDGTIDASEFASRMGMPLVADEAHGIWALGPRAGGNCLDSAELPPIVLDDFDGRSFDLASLRGRKMLLTTWSSW